MKVQISLLSPLRNDPYISNETEITDAELEKLEELCQKAVSGDPSYFSMESENKIIYFGKDTLSKSVLSLIKIV